LMLKMPLQNPFEELFDLNEQKIVNDMISLYRGEKGLNPKVLCINDKFRIDEFVECKNLDFSDYQDSEMMKQLARILCDFHHDVVMKEKYVKLRGENTLPIRMLGMRKVFLKNFPQKKKLIETEVPEQYKAQFEKYYEISDLLFVNEKNFQKMMEVLTEDMKNGNLTMSHNDPHQFNMLKIGKTIQLIDFDGSNLAFPGADIGYVYHNSTTDFKDNFSYKPQFEWSEETKKAFLVEYLTHFYNNYQKEKKVGLQDFLKIEVEKLKNSVERGLNLGHIFYSFFTFGTTELVMYKWLGYQRIERDLQRMIDLENYMKKYL